MNFKQYFTQAVGWKREKSRRGVQPMPKLSQEEKELLRQWRHTLKVGDYVDIIDDNYYPPGVLVDNEPIKEIVHINANKQKLDNYDMEDLLITAGFLGTNGIAFYPPGYMPGDMTRKQLKKEINPSTAEKFGELINEL